MWTYKLERYDLMCQTGYTNVQTTLNEHGKEGWEFVTVLEVREYPFVLFRREVPVAQE